MALITRGAAVGAPARLDPFPAVRTEVDDHPALAGTLLRVLEEKKAEFAGRLAQGQCKSFDEYRYLVGQIEGLDIAIAACRHTQSRLTA